ncbi:MAG: peptidylprolyl isomerase [Anaerolineae bacterium]
MRTAALILTCLILASSVAACDRLAGDQNEASGNDAPNEQALDDQSAQDADAADDASSDLADQGAAAGDATGTGADSAAVDDSGGNAATVNGVAIPLADFQSQAFDTQRFYVEQGIDPNSEEGQRQLLYLRRQVLDNMINQTLIEMAAAEMGITTTEDEVDERLQANYYDTLGEGEELEAALADLGTSLDEIRDIERANIISGKMLDEITADVPTTARFVHARHILCNSQEDCEAALARLDSGEAFEDVAKDVSEDAASAERGGDLDWITAGMLPSLQLEEAIFGLGVGERSAVVLTDFGYHVIEVLDEDESRELSEEQRFTLREKQLGEWLTERRAESDIVIYIDDLKNLGE